MPKIEISEKNIRKTVMVRIITYNSVCPKLPGFKPSKAAAISDIIKRKNGSMLGVVHPGYFGSLLNSGALRQKYNAIQWMDSKAYASYLKRLEYRVSKEKVVLLFAYNERSALKWAFGSKAPGPFILIRTGRTPIPCLPKYKDEKDKWETLAGTLKGLGVTRLYLAGEENRKVSGNAGTYGKVMGKNMGCVNIAFNNLKDLLDVNIIDALTFPGSDVHIESPRIVIVEG